MTPTVETFKDAMRNAGIQPPEAVLADGKMHRFTIPEDRAKSNNGWYIFHGDGVPAGAFGCWKRGVSETWCGKEATTMSPAEKARHKANMEAIQREREEAQQRIWEECREWCAKTWASAPPATDGHPYLQKKGVSAYGIKTFGAALIIPARSIDGTVHGLQFIQADGSKKFKTGTNKKGHFYKIGTSRDNTVVIVEGYATGASIHQATGHAVVVAFDAGNLLPVAQEIRQKFPSIKIIIAADDDHASDGNPGVTKATAAAQAVNGVVAVPSFPGDRPEGATDFNDLHHIEGIEAVRLQVEAVAEPAAEACDDAADVPATFNPYAVAALSTEFKQREVRIEYLVDGLIPEGFITLWYAPSGAGKSTLATQLAQAVADGAPFLGQATKQAEVFYLDYENPDTTVVERLKKVGGVNPFFIWPSSSETPPPQLDTPEKTQLFGVKPGTLLILDTLKASNNSDENDATKMKPIFDFLKQLRNHGLTIIILHHTSKGVDGNYRGSSVIQDQSDHCIALTKVKAPGNDQEAGDDDETCVYRLGVKGKTRARPFKMFVEFDQGAELFRAVDNPDVAAMDAIADAIARMTRIGSCSVNQSNIVLAMKNEDSPVPKKKVLALLKAGEGTRWTVEKGERNASIYVLVESASQLSTFPPYIGGGKLENCPDPFEDEEITDCPFGVEPYDNTEFSSFSGGVEKTGETLLTLGEGDLAW